YVTAKRAVVGEVLFNVFTLVAEGDHKILEPVVRILPHDMPEDGAPADLDHRFRPNLGLFREATAEPTGYNRYLHGLLLSFTLTQTLAGMYRCPNLIAQTKLEACAPGFSGQGRAGVDQKLFRSGAEVCGVVLANRRRTSPSLASATKIGNPEYPNLRGIE